MTAWRASSARACSARMTAWRASSARRARLARVSPSSVSHIFRPWSDPLIILPSAKTDKHTNRSRPPSIILRQVALLKSHTRSVLSSDPLTNILSGSAATHVTPPVCSLNMLRVVLEFSSHTLTVVSSDPLTIH